MTVWDWVAIFVPVGALVIFATVALGTARRAARLQGLGVSPSLRRDVEALQQRVEALRGDVADLQMRLQVAQSRTGALRR